MSGIHASYLDYVKPQPGQTEEERRLRRLSPVKLRRFIEEIELAAAKQRDPFLLKSLEATVVPYRAELLRREERKPRKQASARTQRKFTLQLSVLQMEEIVLALRELHARASDSERRAQLFETIKQVEDKLSSAKPLADKFLCHSSAK